MSRECGPCVLGSVLYLCGFLAHECDHLSQTRYFSFWRKYFYVHPVDFDFSFSVSLLICQDLGFVWVDVESLRFCRFFEVRDHFFELFLKEAAIMSTSSAKRRFDMKSFSFSSLRLMRKPFSFQVSMSFSIADWRTELKRRLLERSPCSVPRAIPKSSLSTSVSTVTIDQCTFSGGKCIVH